MRFPFAFPFDLNALTSEVLFSPSLIFETIDGEEVRKECSILEARLLNTLATRF